MLQELSPSPRAADPSAGVSENPHIDAPDLRAFVIALFFIFGGITSLNDVVIPKLKSLFTLSYADAMLVQSAFFAAYFFVSLPAAAIVRRIGYMRTAVVGLVLMMGGCLLFVPASLHGVFVEFLVALFVLAAGITIVQVVANPLISMLGKPATAHSRLTFAQAFNSLGTTVFPYVGSAVILGSIGNVNPSVLSGDALTAFRTRETHIIVLTYLALATALGVIAAVVWQRRHRLQEMKVADESILRAFGLLARPRFAFGTACIFLYVGAEVAIGSIIVNFLMQGDVFGLPARDAGEHLIYYWGGAMVGRFVGSWLLRVYSPGKVLACAAAAAISLILVASLGHGPVSGWALLGIGLCNSIMFPTVFTLACEGIGARTHEGSGIICIAIVGGAVVPLLLGYLADSAGLRVSLLVPAACYLTIMTFGIYARKPWQGQLPAV